MSAIFVMIICCAGPITAHADLEDVEQTISDKIEGTDLDTKYGTYDDFRSGYNVSTENIEFLCKYHIFRTATNEEYYFTSGLSIPQNQIADYVDSAVMDGSMFDINFNRSVYFYVGWKNGSLQCNNSWYFNISRLTFDTGSNTLNLYDDSGNLITQDFFTGEQFSSIVIDDYTTNFEEFTLDDVYDVSVSFSPDLRGNVDRSIINPEGTKSMLSNLVMTVTNNCNFDIQYYMRIMKKTQVTHRYSRENSDANFSAGSKESSLSLSYDDDPVFIYYSDEWVYTHEIDDMYRSMNNSFFEKANKSTQWHFLPKGSTATVTFDWSQINMTEGEEYVCTVTCVRNDYGIASTQIVFLASDDPAYPELKQIQGDNIQTVYNSEFVMINYSDVVYDPNNTNNGVKPYNGKNGILDNQTYAYSRNAREDKDGNIDYSGKNLISDKNSWLNQQYNNAFSNHQNYYSSSGSVPSSLAVQFNSFLSFVNSIFSNFPNDIRSVYIYGFVGIVVLGIILKVIK